VTQTLGWWRGRAPDAALARVGEHPRLPEAVAAASAAMLDLSLDEPALGGVFKDAGRYAATMAAFHLHETEGLSLPRLKAVCVSSGLLSPGRARLLLQVLQHLGCLTALAGPGRAAAYGFTEGFLRAWTAHLRAALAAAGVVEPEAEALLRRADRRWLLTFGRIHAAGWLTVTDEERALRELFPILRVFLHAYGGAQMLWTLLTASQDGAFPPRRAGPVTVAGLARRFDVSRIHVRRIFDAAEQAGLASLGADGWVTFTDAAQDQLRLVWCAQLAHILAAAAEAEAELEGQICTV
jgi:hypothetical protein